MYRLLIDGVLTKGDLELEVINPASEEVIAVCSRASREQLQAAVAAAKRAFPAWAATPLQTRKQLLSKLGDLVEVHSAELARLLTLEQGKPLRDATGEVLYTALAFRHIAGLEFPPEVLEDSGQRHAEIVRKPLGVVAAITPWNFPIVTPALKIAPALLAGNTVVVKVAPTTPLTMLKFAELARDILPPGVLNIIVDNNDLGQELTTHPDIAKITFTGSTVTGRKIMGNAAESIKRLTLELGGNDAAIILDDADPKTAAAGVFSKAFANNGQVCVAIKRLYVHETQYDEVCKELVALAKASVVGDGLNPSTTLGPVQNKAQLEKLKGFLIDAHENGTVLTGGKVMDRAGYFIEPTIVADVMEGSRIVDEEQFGPILPVIKYVDVPDAVKRANASCYGLGGSVWSTNRERALEVAKQIDAGSVWINKHDDAAVHLPFGGAKQSGFGVDGLEEYTQLQLVNS